MVWYWKEGAGELALKGKELTKLLCIVLIYDDFAVQNVELEDYIKHLKVGQQKIHYITVDSYTVVKNNIHVELLPTIAL